jgi:hypothetical protein
VQGTISTEERTVAIDFADELDRLRAANIENTTLPDAAATGRYTFIALANREGGAWVETPTPGPRRQTPSVEAPPAPLDRILGLVFSS